MEWRSIAETGTSLPAQISGGGGRCNAGAVGAPSADKPAPIPALPGSTKSGLNTA